MSKAKKVLFEAEGLTVFENSTYTVQHRPDPSAPSGFQSMGATKLPSDGIDETFYARWIGEIGDEGIWDTGFYEHSPMYAGLEEAEVKKIVDRRIERVLEPYRKVTGNKDAFALGHPSVSKIGFKVWEGQTLNTRNPKDVMTLYFALLKRKVVVDDNLGDTSYDSAPYRISNMNESVTNQEKEAVSEMDAIFEFKMLQKNDQERLRLILNYVGLNIDTDSKPSAQALSFKRLIKRKDDLEAFLRIAEESESEKGLDKLAVYDKLKTQARTGGELTRAKNGVYFYEEVEIGADLKVAADVIAKQAKFKDIKAKILLD